LGTLAEFLNKIGGKAEGEGERIQLFGWVKEVVTKAAATALYGPSNPITSDSSLVESLWYFPPLLPKHLRLFME